MAIDMFLKITGIDGESLDAQHKNEIDVLAWSWGLSQSGTFHTGGGGGSGKVSVQDLSFTHYTDLASTPLMLSCAKGEHVSEAVLTVRKAGGTTPIEYLVVTMKKVMVTSVSQGGSDGEHRLTENVTLNFGEVKVTYTAQTESGSKGSSKDFGWDVEANQQA